MKNRFLPLMMLLCFVCSGIARAAIVQIGESTYSQNCYPIKTDWKYSLTQQIYTAEEIGTKGTINSIAFEYAYGEAFSLEGIQVYMKTTSKNTFDSHNDMVQVSASDKVFEGTVSASGPGWVTLFLDTPFVYDGINNLLVCFNSPINGFLTTENSIFYCTYTANTMADSFYSDYFVADITNLASYQGAAWSNNFRANIRMDITPVMIGSPASETTQYDLPVNMYYNYSLTQQIFTAEEIGTAGTINFIAFDYAYNSSFSMENVQVYMKNVLKDSFETTTDMVAISSSDKVWEGTFSATGMGWVTLTLDTPFEYDGNSNLLVCFYDPTSGYPGSSYKFHSTATSGYQAIAYYSDNSSYIPNLNNLSSYGDFKNYYQYRSNIQIGITPDPNWTPCNKPVNLTASNVTSSQATLTWEGAADAGFNVEYKKASDTDWTYAIGIGGNSWTLTGLDQATNYMARVNAVCGNNLLSAYVTTTFTTQAAIPFFEDFSTTSLPTCWARYSGLLNDVMAGTASLSSVTNVWNFGTYNGAFGNSNHAYINIYGTGRKHWLVTPQVTMENNCQLSFELALTDYYGTMQPIDPTQQPDDRFVVLASTDNGATWTILREWNNTGSPYVYNNILATGEDVIIDLSAYQGTDLMIAFYGESTVTNNGDNNLHIDNVSIDYIPACQKPSNFHVSSIAERSVVLSWDAPEGQNHWEVGYKTDDEQGYQWFVEPTENPYVFSGHPNNPLQPETHYTVKVRALCNGFSSTSYWSKEIDFTTLEACPVPTNLHVTHITPHGVTAYFDPGSPTQTIWYYNFTTTNTPPTYANGSTTFVQHYIYYPEHWQMFQPETHYYLWVGIECDEGGTTSWAWGEPTEFTTPPICPEPTDVTITEVTTHGFSASFTPGGDWQNSWYFAWTTENVAPTAAPGNTTVTEFGVSDISSILSGTTYYLWVGTYCDEDNSYHWAESVQFTTPYACSTKLYAQDVEIDDVQPHEVSLDWGDSPATADQWQVYYSYDNVLPANEAYINQVAVTTDEPYVSIDGLFSDLDYYFWIRALCDVWYGTPEWGEWSDMITVHTEVSCYPPINVTVSNITSTTATITWEPNPSTMISVEYYEVNIESDDWGDPYVAIVDEPYLELDLDGWVDEGGDLLCSVYVHAYCGQMEGLSEASETVGFILTDKEQLTLNDGTATNEYVPVYGYYCDNYSKGQFIIPAEDIEDMRYSEISWMTFYANNDYVDWGDAEFEVYMMELPCETEFASATLYDWYDMDLVRSEGSLSIRNGLMVVDLEEPFFYTDGNLLIGFKQTIDGTWKHSYWYGVNTTTNSALGGYETSKGVAIQQFLPKTSFVYEPTGSACIKPTNFTVGRVDATTIECAWTPGGDETLWEIAWGGEDFDPNDNTTWMSHSYGPYNPCWIFDFTPDMTYNFAIRAVCNQGQGVYSNWTCPVSFTLETCPTPTNITFDISATDATVNWEGIGDTWITLYRGNYEMSSGFETQTLEGWTSEGDAAWTVGVGDYQTSPGTHSGNYNAKITHTADDNETWLISPMMDLTNVHIAYLDFWYINRSWSGDVDELGVYYRIDEGDWNPLFITAEAHETWTSQRVNLALLATNDNCQIGFKMTDHYGYGVGIDDIKITGFTYNGGYWVYAPDQSITFTNLYPNTLYTLDLVSSCDGVSGGASGWMYFTTLPAAIFIADGNWNDSNSWFAGEVPEDGTVIIRADAVIPDGYVAWADQIELDGGSITIADGGQLRAGNDVEVTVEKNITGYGSGNGNYYLIANPLWVDVNATDVEGLISSNAADYDLYSFDPEGPNNGADDEYAYREWRNYKAGSFPVEFGYGYLYANKENVTLRFTGNATYNNYGGRALSLQYDEDTEALFGNWFLTGNFYTCNSYLVYVNSNNNVTEANFYVMNEAGTDLQLSETQASLKLCEGAFIEKPTNGKIYYLTYNPGFAKSGMLNITLTQGEGEIDQARIRFGAGHNLSKLSMRNKSTISIPQDSKDFAVVYTDNRGEVPVSFKALTDGSFTMNFSNEEVEFSYLHLIDNLTGEDIDLLDTSTGSVSDYTFEARTTDKADRFKVVFVTAE